MQTSADWLGLRSLWDSESTLGTLQERFCSRTRTHIQIDIPERSEIIDLTNSCWASILNRCVCVGNGEAVHSINKAWPLLFPMLELDQFPGPRMLFLSIKFHGRKEWCQSFLYAQLPCIINTVWNSAWYMGPTSIEWRALTGEVLQIGHLSSWKQKWNVQQWLMPSASRGIAALFDGGLC